MYKISNVENNLDNTSFNIKNYITNDILIVNHIELNNDVVILKVYIFLILKVYIYFAR